jgi:hypothetical protein
MCLIPCQMSGVTKLTFFDNLSLRCPCSCQLLCAQSVFRTSFLLRIYYCQTFLTACFLLPDISYCVFLTDRHFLLSISYCQTFLTACFLLPDISYCVFLTDRHLLLSVSYCQTFLTAYFLLPDIYYCVFTTARHFLLRISYFQTFLTAYFLLPDISYCQTFLFFARFSRFLYAAHLLPNVLIFFLLYMLRLFAGL